MLADLIFLYYMSPAITIELYNPTDFIELFDVFKTNVPSYFAPEEIEDFQHYLENETEDYFVLKVNEVIKAAGGINYDSSKAKLSWDFVQLDAQGKGYGSMLLQHRIAHLANKLQVQTLSVRTSQLAFRFYEKNQFKLINVIKDYWATNFDLYEMLYEPSAVT